MLLYHCVLLHLLVNAARLRERPPPNLDVRIQKVWGRWTPEHFPLQPLYALHNADSLIKYLSDNLVINLYMLFLLIKENDSMLLRLIYSELKWFFASTQILFALPFLAGVIFGKIMAGLIISVTLNLLIFVFLIFFYKDIKLKKNLTVGSLICISVYTSLILAFTTYTCFYNLSEILSQSLSKSQNDIDINLIKEILCISCYSIFSVLCIILLTHYKDVVFSLMLIYFLLGYLASENTLNQREFITVIILFSLLFMATLITLIKYGKGTFGYEDSREDLEHILQARCRHKKSSWFNGEFN